MAAFVLNLALVTALFLWAACTRNVDGDEGLYLEAARMVSRGQRLYLDFFYQQMPLIPYFYAAIGKLFGFSIYPARVFSALLTAGGVGFVLYYLAKTTRSVFMITVASILCYANGLLLAWAPVIKTHPFNVFCLTGASVLALLWSRAERRSRLSLALAGLLLGIGVNCRLTLAPFPLFFLIFIFAHSESGGWKNAGIFVLAMLISCLPTLYYLGLDFQLFLKYNLIYHTRVYPGIAGGDFRVAIAKQVLLEPQMIFLLALAYGGMLLRSRPGWGAMLGSDECFVLLLLAAFFAIHLGTATPFTQYFSTVIPLLVLAGGPVWTATLRLCSSLRTVALAPVLILYAAFCPRLMHQELYSVGSLEPQWRLKNIETTVRLLKRFAKPGEICLTWWPGYAVMAGCASYPEMENHMREHAILKGVPARRLKEYKLLPEEELLEALEDRKARVVVDGAYRLDTPYHEYADYLLSENYRLRLAHGGVKFYTLVTDRDLEVERDALAAAEPLHQLEKSLPKPGRGRPRR